MSAEFNWQQTQSEQSPFFKSQLVDHERMMSVGLYSFLSEVLPNLR